MQPQYHMQRARQANRCVTPPAGPAVPDFLSLLRNVHLNSDGVSWGADCPACQHPTFWTNGDTIHCGTCGPDRVQAALDALLAQSRAEPRTSEPSRKKPRKSAQNAATHRNSSHSRHATTETTPGTAEEAAADEGGKTPRKTTAQRLIELADEATLFRSERDEPFARFTNQDHAETWPLRSKWFRTWLCHRFFNETGKPPGKQAAEDALNVLEWHCLFGGQEHTLSVRTALGEQPGELLFDLCDSAWCIVRITASGWEVVSGDASPRFRRFAPLAPQVEPVRGGTLDALRTFLNVAGDPVWQLLVAWLVAAFFPLLPHPVLVVHGEQGSAKSSFMRLLSLLIDPSRTPLRSEPRDLGEWVQAADHSWLVTLDNVSHLPGWLSDAICRAVTGEGFSKRQLYTDGDDVIICFRRVVALTGIEVVAQRADLLDRAILTGLEPIAPDKRRPESDLLAEFERERPAIFGALLDAVVGTLRELPKVHLTHSPRMADFARVGVAVERALGWPAGSFLAAYMGNVNEQSEEAISAATIGEPLRAFLRGNGEWSGTPAELLEALTEQVTNSGTARAPQDWPKNPRALSGQLRRIAPALRGVGITATFIKSGKRRVTLISDPARTESQTTVPTDHSAPSFGAQDETRTVGPVARTVEQPEWTVDEPDSTHEEDDWDGADEGMPDDSELTYAEVKAKYGAQLHSDLDSL